MIHWCQDETNAVLAGAGSAGVALIWVRAYWTRIVGWVRNRK